ncbi:hypothetical protein MCBMB27_05291 [Methylobacterium phyllosphaerae]|uniref:Uncharacterized protein n=1 Tax=Methylobacterium phyllosphaerae TaxID=418223 RepID=A0AAE8HTV9_9HYPH|nr:hypothetical protein [Methylobacterium phyllosphaerae]APT34582.1 hypothetical protein MCBMB27_05291 [Methylobacterium phyllosphaerae]SFH18758.1 hypothetical protein SAMN05192567_1166 [Methylobacterium phyllosphaerae]
MPHNETIALSGTITHVFAHRFTLEAEGATHLADLGPKGAEAFSLSPGLPVSLEGERRPSEIKVTRIETAGRAPVTIEHKKPNHAPGHKPANGPADVNVVLAAARKSGWETHGDPRQKPKHFEVLALRDQSGWTELHIDFAGTIYKQKPADAEKWSLAA